MRHGRIRKYKKPEGFGGRKVHQDRVRFYKPATYRMTVVLFCAIARRPAAVHETAEGRKVGKQKASAAQFPGNWPPYMSGRFQVTSLSFKLRQQLFVLESYYRLAIQLC